MRKRRNRSEEEIEDDWEEEDEEDWLEDNEEVEYDDYDEDEEDEETYFMADPLFCYIRKNPESSVKWHNSCGEMIKDEPIINFMCGMIYKNVALYHCIYPMGIIGSIEVQCDGGSWTSLFSGN